jgi:hypothetical protein
MFFWSGTETCKKFLNVILITFGFCNRRISLKGGILKLWSPVQAGLFIYKDLPRLRDFLILDELFEFSYVPKFLHGVDVDFGLR